MAVGPRDVAAALDGDARQLARIATLDSDGAIARAHRVSGALYLRANAAGIEGSSLAAWRRDMASLAARYLLLRRALEACGESLASAGVTWLPIKGNDLATRFYDQVEERQTADLDILIASEDFPRARAALSATGWTELATGPRARRYVAEEGYAWQATGHGVLLEVHFRLWGSVAEGLATEIVEASVLDPNLPGAGRRCSAAHAYVLAAVHSWLSTSPRGVGIFRDLERVGAGSLPTLAREVVEIARRWDLQLPVALASGVAADLWQDEETCSHIAQELQEDLRGLERWLWKGTHRKDPYDLSLGRMTAARLLAGRRMRLGVKIAWRRLWDHSGVVEASTPEGWPWIARRVAHQLAGLGLSSPSRRNEARRNEPVTSHEHDQKPEP